VEWYVDGKAKKEFFATAQDRNTKGTELARARRQQYVPLDRDQTAGWSAFKAAIGDTPWPDVVAGWKEYCRIKGVTHIKRTVREACTEYLTHCQKLLDRHELAPDTFRHRRQKTGLLADSFGANQLSSLTGPALEKWIESDLEHDDPYTFNNYRKILSGIFNFYRKELPGNPVEDIKPRDEAVDEITLLKVKEAAKLFAWAAEHGRHVVGRLALEAFAGLRFTSAAKLEKSDINFSDRGVLLPAPKIKTRRRQYVDGYPETMWPWINLASPACWALTPIEYMHAKSDAFAAAGVTNPGNCLRHSFATYHCAHFKNPGLIATLLCHKNQQRLWEHYKGRATQSDGEAYFKITPITAKAMAEA
jgi:integrase